MRSFSRYGLCLIAALWGCAASVDTQCEGRSEAECVASSDSGSSCVWKGNANLNPGPPGCYLRCTSDDECGAEHRCAGFDNNTGPEQVLVSESACFPR